MSQRISKAVQLQLSNVYIDKKDKDWPQDEDDARLA